MITDVKINEAENRRFYESGAWGTDTIADVWQDRSTRFADRVYVQDDLGCSLTYREVDEGASRIAAWLTCETAMSSPFRFPNGRNFA